MSPEEEKLLELLLKKREDEQKKPEAPVFQLIQGSGEKNAWADTLETAARMARAQELADYALVIVPKDGSAKIFWGQAEPTLNVVAGASLLSTLLNLSVKRT